MRWIIELINSRIKKDKERKENELDYNLPKLILFLQMIQFLNL